MTGTWTRNNIEKSRRILLVEWEDFYAINSQIKFQKALIAYVEWKINEELQIVKKTRKMEVSKIRPRNLNETADSVRVLRQIKSQSSNLCSPRFVEVFYTLDETYGQETVIGMIRVVSWTKVWKILRIMWHLIWLLSQKPSKNQNSSRSLTNSLSPQPPSLIGHQQPKQQPGDAQKPELSFINGTARLPQFLAQSFVQSSHRIVLNSINWQRKRGRSRWKFLDLLELSWL